MQFSELNLEPTLIQDIEKLGYGQCTDIQEKCIPLVLEGKDIAGLAQTGTGKTAAFLVPLIDRILKSKARMATETDVPRETDPRAFNQWRANQFILILVPTRELAEQVYENIQKLCFSSGLKGYPLYGGTGYDKQTEAVKNGLDFIVATPGRLIDLYKEHYIDLKMVRAIVFDEADRMFDMGFKDDMKYILQRIPNDRQFLVFSATLNFDVLNTAYQFGAEPIEINVSKDQAKAENVKDEIFHVGQEDKPKYLLSLLKKHNPRQAIIFSNFKNNVERISDFLSANQIPAMGISSLLTQAQRNKVIELFKAENDRNILVATDVAARGLDIKGVDLVINYEMPQDPESYVHRIGRTGRAGAMGTAYSLVSDLDVDSLARVETYLKAKLGQGWIEDTELVTEFKSFQRDSYHGHGDSKPRFQRNDGRQGGGDRGPRKQGGSGNRQDRDFNGHGKPQQKRHDRGPDRQNGDRPYNKDRADQPRDAKAQGSHPNSHKRFQNNDTQGKPHTQTANGAYQGGKPQDNRARHSAGGDARPNGQRPSNKGAAGAAKTAPSIVEKVGKFLKGLFGGSTAKTTSTNSSKAINSGGTAKPSGTSRPHQSNHVNRSTNRPYVPGPKKMATADKDKKPPISPKKV